MCVDQQRLHWREGEWLVFDDTYEHEVRNDSSEPRIVLLCQVARPLKPPGSWLASAILTYVRRSHFVTEAQENLVEWETVYAKAESEER